MVVAARAGCPWPLASRLIGILTGLHQASRITIAHAALQLVVACHLAQRLGRVELEVDGCDVVAPDAGLAVEVETGFIPPRAAVNPRTYLAARLAAKLARCAQAYPYQAVAYPVHLRVPVPKPLTTPPQLRTSRDNERLYRLARIASTSVTPDMVTRVNLVALMRVDPERGTVKTIPLSPTLAKTPNP